MRNFRSVVAALVVAAFTTSALAQPATPATPAGESDSPWAKGVSAEDQQAANALFKEGNALMRDSFFVQAVEKYRAAVGHWDHPAIHYNLAIALINLDQPLEVYASLEKALGYGEAALDDEKRELAERYMKLVSQQLSLVTVTCDVPDAKVYIDGKEAFTGPGKVERRVRAGEHTFTATKPGFETASMTRMLPGGQPAAVPLKLYRPEELTRYKRHFAPWLPWAVTGAGVAVAGIGAAIHSSARSDFTAFDQWAADCEEDSGMACAITDEAQSLRDGGDQKQSIAVGMYVAGAATVVAGLTMVLINRPQPYRVDSESPEPKGVVVVPAIGDGQVGVSASLRF